MINLIMFLILIMFFYFLFMYKVMKVILPWKYKALLYGFITFIMLIGVFILFGIYDKYWKIN